MTRQLICIALLTAATIFPGCKKERCLKCTTTVSGVETVQPEICDKDKKVLNAEQERYEQSVNEFVQMGWEASVNCIRQ